MGTHVTLSRVHDPSLASHPISGSPGTGKNKTVRWLLTSKVFLGVSAGLSRPPFGDENVPARAARRAQTSCVHVRDPSIIRRLSTDDSLFHSAFTGADVVANGSGSAMTKIDGSSSGEPSTLNAPVPKRRRTAEKTTRSVNRGGKKKDASVAEEDVNSLFWLVEVRDLHICPPPARFPGFAS